MATHSSVLPWEIPWTESLVGFGPWGCKELDTTERLSTQRQCSKTFYRNLSPIVTPNFG